MTNANASHAEPDPTQGHAKQRLFFALWPDDQVRERLYAVGEPVSWARPARRVAMEKLHLTLMFLGYVDEAQRECAVRVAADIKESRFTLTIDQARHWSRSKILWAGTDAIPPGLLAIVAQLRDGLAACGVKPEDRDYRCHVTLGRNVRRKPVLTAIEAIRWPVDQFVLVESNTLPAGAQYRIIGAWDLG